MCSPPKSEKSQRMSKIIANEDRISLERPVGARIYCSLFHFGKVINFTKCELQMTPLEIITYHYDHQ